MYIILFILLFILLISINIFFYYETFTNNFFNPYLNQDPIPKTTNPNIDSYYNENIILPTFDNSINQSNRDKIFDNRINFKSVIYSNDNIQDQSHFIKSDKCCLVSKKYDQDGFSYTYKPLYNNDCNINLYELDQNNKLLFDGQDLWDNKFCENNLNDNILGSCRRHNWECFDFITKEKCANLAKNDRGNGFLKFNKNPNVINLKWNKGTCQDHIDNNNDLSNTKRVVVIS